MAHRATITAISTRTTCTYVRATQELYCGDVAVRGSRRTASPEKNLLILAFGPWGWFLSFRF